MTSPSRGWVWIRPDIVYAVHDEQLADHGGMRGVRDANALESALARPEQLANDGEPDVAALAASYGFGIARNHPFVDGNKRTAYVAMELFLALNGYALEAEDGDCVITMLGVAAGNMDEASFAQWIRAHTVNG